MSDNGDADTSAGGRRRGSDLAVPTAAYCAVAAVVGVVQYLGTRPPRTLAAVWIRYDAGAYLTVARRGYAYSSADPYPEVAWFPGYSLLIRAANVLIGDVVASGVAVTYAAGLTATLLLWRWMEGHGIVGRERLLGLGTVLLFAWGWFLYGIVYADALFLALAVGAFVLVDRDRVVLGSLVAGLAGSVRPMGIPLALGLTVLVLERDGAVFADWHARRRIPRIRVARNRLRRRHLATLLCWSGIVAFSGFLGWRFGRPLLWLEVQDRWNQGPAAGPESWFKVHMLALIVKNHDPAYLAKALTQLAAVAAAFALVPAVTRRFGLGYGVYVGAVLAMVSIGSNDFVGPGRYLLAVFPVAAVVGAWMSPRPRRAAAVLGVSTVAMIGQSFLFARDVYLT